MGENLLKDDLVQDFIDITLEVMETMANIKVTSKGSVEINGSHAGLDVTSCMDITGILGFSGGRRGSILVTFSAETALKAVGGMLGIEFDKIDGDVRDGVGELVNMIAGGAKTKLQNKGVDFELSIPNTVIGNQHEITAPQSTSRVRMDFESTAGNFFIEVYLKKE